MLAEHQFFFFALEHPKDIFPALMGLAILFGLLYRFGFPAAKTGMADRATRVETDIRQVDAQLEDVARLRNDYATRIQQIEHEQRERIAAAVRDADNARAEIVADAEATAILVRRRGEEELGRERTRQRILLRQQMVQLTLDAAEQAVRAQNTDAVQRQLIRNFVGQVSGNGAHADSFYPTATESPVVAPAFSSEVDVLPEGTAAFGIETPAIDFTAPDDTPAPIEFEIEFEGEGTVEKGTVEKGTIETGDLDFTTPNFGAETPDFGTSATSETEGGA